MASELPRSLDTASKFALFSVSGFKDEKFIKKQTYMKTEVQCSSSLSLVFQVSILPCLIPIVQAVYFIHPQDITRPPQYSFPYNKFDFFQL